MTPCISVTTLLLSATAARLILYFVPLNGIHGSVTNMVCFWSMFSVACMQYACTSMHRPVHRGVHWVCTNPHIYLRTQPISGIVQVLSEDQKHHFLKLCHSVSALLYVYDQRRVATYHLVGDTCIMTSYAYTQ